MLSIVGIEEGIIMIGWDTVMYDNDWLILYDDDNFEPLCVELYEYGIYPSYKTDKIGNM
jgi:hypothetical protein